MVRRILLLVSVFCLVFAGALGCSTTPDKKDEALTKAEDRVPSFFEDIPATTPYVMTSLEPFPMEVLEPYMATYAEMYESLNQQLQQQQRNYQSNMDPGEKFAFALFEEMSKAKNIEGYKKLGFSTRPQAAMYGIGWFPVMRMTLGNAKAFEGMISRLETKSGLEVQMSTLGEQSYRHYDLGEEIKVALAVTDNEVIMGLAPTEAFGDFVAYMLGQKKPARSLADVGVIEDIRTKYGFMPYAIGYADVVGIVGAATGAAPGDQITRAMLKAIDYTPPAMTEVCRAEFMSMVEKAPRVVMGYTELSAEVMEITSVIETQGDFARELAATSAPMPAYATGLVDNAFFAAGLGLDMQKFIGFISQQAARINQDPFQCPDLKAWNDAAQQAKMASQLIPPFVSGLRGAMAVVSDVELDPQTFQPMDVDALALIRSSDPAGLFSQLQMYVPQLQGVAVKGDGVPVALPPIPDASFVQVPHIAMDPDSLAASAGVGMQDEMAVLLENPAESTSTDTPMLLVAYDYGKLMEMFTQGMNAYGTATGAQSPLGSSFDALKNMFGTFVGEVDANDDGVVMRYRLNMFPDQAAAAAP
jgi:hypothetical protein